MKQALRIAPGQVCTYQGARVRILAVDSDPTAAVQVVYLDDPDRDAFALRSELTAEVDPAEAGAAGARADVAAASLPDAVEAFIAKVAREELGVETLETRNSDRLDFHDVSVASLKAALTRVFHAGAATGSGL